MTDLVPATPPGEIEEWSEEELMSVGMEDFDPNKDAIMPTIRIDHKEGVFVDALSGEKFPTLEKVVLLGLIKQRVLWEPEVEENSQGPLCRSYNYEVGMPDPKRFPWADTAFDPSSVTLPCEACPLKDWGSHPKRDTPWCSEQHTFALLQPIDNGWAPALLTVQRSAIKPSKTYLTNFSRSRTALFTVFTRIELDHRRRGTVDFAVPKFSKGEATSQEEWRFFAQNYQQIKVFVTTPRVRDDEEEDGSTPPATSPAASAAAAPVPAPAPPAAASVPPAAAEPTPTAPVAAAPAPAEPPAAPAAPAATVAPAVPDEEEELPF